MIGAVMYEKYIIYACVCCYCECPNLVTVIINRCTLATPIYIPKYIKQIYIYGQTPMTVNIHRRHLIK